MQNPSEINGSIPKRRGGFRPGAGRPKKLGAGVIALPTITSPPAGASPSEMAKPYTGLIIEVLASIAARGASESARVMAAKILFEVAYGRPAPMAPLGKKEQSALDAEAAGAGTKWEDLLN